MILPTPRLVPALSFLAVLRELFPALQTFLQQIFFFLIFFHIGVTVFCAETAICIAVSGEGIGPVAHAEIAHFSFLEPGLS